MDTKFRLKFYLTVFIIVIIFGSLGFSYVEKIPLDEAVYFNIVTIATVGYGDIHPTTQAGRIMAIFLIVMGVGTFLGVVANATEMMLNRREKQSITNKIFMLVGIFYSESGNQLMKLFSSYDPDIQQLIGRLNIKGDWDRKKLNAIAPLLKNYAFSIDIQKVDLIRLLDFLQKNRSLMVRLIEHPTLLEHETFADLLRAVFHLTEELNYRQDLANLPDHDRAHLCGDIQRIYKLLVTQWVDYMIHLKDFYPYLFSLEVRMSPYNPEPSAIIAE
jgi:hypothetical protein